MSLLADARYGFRSLAKSPAFTIVALATLGLAIGVNGAVFAITNGILFKSLPFENAERIVYLSTRNADRTDQFLGVSFPDFRDVLAQAQSFEGLAAFSGAQLNVGGDDNLSEVYPAAQLSTNSFRLIGQHPVAGRDFEPADDKPGAPPVAILTYGLWQRRYGRDPGTVGRVVRINGVPTTIIGVMPPAFSFPFNVDLWTPLPITPNTEKRDARGFGVYGALKDRTSLETARAEIATVSSNLQRAYPDTNGRFSLRLQTYHEQVVGNDLAIIFSAMMVAVAFVLLIACANVANLQLARALGRVREISVRVALGATRRQIVQQLLVESVLLSAVAGVVGLVLAYWGARTFDLVITPMGKPSWMTFGLDPRVLTYLAMISVGTGVIFGLAPALRLSRLDVHATLKDGSRGAGRSVQHKRLAAALVVVELALAVVLLSGAGIMIRSFLNVYKAPLGINSANVLTMRIALPAIRYQGGERQIAFYDSLKARLESLPGVSTVAIGNVLPTGGSTSLPYELDGANAVDAQHRATLSAVVISPAYFQIWDVHPARGRAFTETDGVTGPPVAIVNEAFAARNWPGSDPLTKRLRVFNGTAPEPWLNVVGVVPNIVHNDISPRKLDPVIYLPFRQRPQAGVALMARTTVLPGTLTAAVRREVQTLDADLPIFNLWTMEERLQRNYSFTGVIGSLFATFAIVALVLASVGLYAVIAYAVRQRTQEIGVRIAVGATARSIMGLVFGEAMWQLAIGLVIGMAAALALTRVLTKVLIGVSPSDPLSFGVAAMVLTVAAVCGTLLPARRAMGVDPVIALRND
jgi:putative ABC transport system permease protein